MIPTIEITQPIAASSEPHNSPAGQFARTASHFIVQDLLHRGINVVSGIPGGAILPLYDAVADSPLRHVLARNEQGAGFIAQGMARATGKAAVCFATSGPGATNLVTALADALADSVPLVALTAQVPRNLIGTDAFQEVATCALMRPVTKACWRVERAEQLPALLNRAFAVAQTGRQGPVLLDIPKDILSAAWQPAWERNPKDQNHDKLREMCRRTAARCTVYGPGDPGVWRRLAQVLSKSQRPLLYVGGGLRWAGGEALLAQLLERTHIPVVTSLHGLGALPADLPHNLGMIGMHGSPSANHATEEADFVLAIGARFDDRATGDPERFCRNARIVHIDVDERELGKIKPIHWGIACDARVALERLLPQVQTTDLSAWLERTDKLRAQVSAPPAGQAGALLQRLDNVLPEECLVTTDVGQHQMWVAQYLGFSPQRKLLTSGGLGTMGFGLPSAIGAALACPTQRVLCVSGDGSLLMNLSELATLSEENLNVTVLLFNNAELGMVRQQQQMFYGNRMSACRFNSQPDFVKIAEGFGVASQRIEPSGATEAWLRRAMSHCGPQLIDVTLGGKENVLPIVPAGASNLEMRMA